MPRGISARALWLAIAGIIVAASVGLLAWYLMRLGADATQNGVPLIGFSAESTGTVAFAGQFPSIEAPPLGGPRGIDHGGGRLYIAMAEAGAIGVFTEDGANLETITIAPAGGSPVSYPIDVAVISAEKLVVVDTSGNRIVVVDPGNPAAASPLGARDEFSIGQPTAVEYFNGELYVADAADGMIKVFDSSGRPLRAIAAGLEPPITYVGDMHGASGTLWVSDSNAGRVLGLDPETGDIIRSIQMRFDLPRGIVSDAAGRIYIAEAFAGIVRVFDSDGTDMVDTVGDEPIEGFDRGATMTRPEALWWNATESRLYVSDPEQGRIKVYNIREEVR